VTGASVNTNADAIVGGLGGAAAATGIGGNGGNGGDGGIGIFLTCRGPLHAGRSATDIRSELGARFDHRILIDNNAVLALRGRAAWAHDWVSDPTLVATFQALPGASFIVNGAPPAKNSALLSAGAELRLANGISIGGKFDGEFSGRSSTYAGTGTMRISW
jgi:outer membrane autotransporter protein